ncbi:MAG: RNA-binding protein, partial [Myxococcota bacterium]
MLVTLLGCGAEEPAPEEQLAGLSLEEQAEVPKLFVGNLSWSVTSEDLEAYLSQAGHVTWCEVKRNYNGQSKGFALASFADVASTEKAIATFHDVEMQGRRLIVRVDSRPEDRPFGRGGGGPQRRTYDEGPRRRSFGEGGGGRRDDPPPSERVFCGNLPFATTQADLDNIFAGSGASYCQLVTDDSGQSRGYAIITFASVDAA